MFTLLMLMRFPYRIILNLFISIFFTQQAGQIPPSGQTFSMAVEEAIDNLPYDTVHFTRAVSNHSGT